MNMTGIIFDIKRFAIHDGPGIRTTVFFKGCPLRCWWCQNPESLNNSPAISYSNNTGLTSSDFCLEESEKVIRKISVDDLLIEITKDRIFYDESGGGVSFSGGEPLMQVEFLKSILDKCRYQGIHTTVDTSGYAPTESFEEILPLVDLFLFDLKIIDDHLHQKYTDASNFLILKNLKFLLERGSKVIIRIPLIPGITDTKKNIEDIFSLLKTFDSISRIDLLPYNEIAEIKYKRLGRTRKLDSLKSQSDEKLEEIKSQLEMLNLEVTIRG
ncbi:MAG: glycyl-radical enzyme activating protein [Ignavibacteriales bacterium]|nr:MAG: glycyl-radical enzyme activating protein [Ignavibacteriales bacterium]